MTRLLAVLLSSLLLATPALADKNADKRAKIDKMSVEVLERLYKEAPHTRPMVKDAEGYGVFSNIGVNVIFVSGGGGNGVDLAGYRDYRGVPVVGAWLWDPQLGLGITTEIDFAEAYDDNRKPNPGGLPKGRG